MRTIESAALAALRADKVRTAAVLGVTATSSWSTKARFALLNANFHSVATYRLGQFASELLQLSNPAGFIVTALHRVMNRWVTHLAMRRSPAVPASAQGV